MRYKDLITIKRKSKNVLYILAAIGLTIIAFVADLWQVWGVIIALMFVESLVSDLKLWADGREKRYLEVLRETRLNPPENTDLLLSLQATLNRVEGGLEALENR